MTTANRLLTDSANGPGPHVLPHGHIVHTKPFTEGTPGGFTGPATRRTRKAFRRWQANTCGAGRSRPLTVRDFQVMGDYLRHCTRQGY